MKLLLFNFLLLLLFNSWLQTSDAMPHMSMNFNKWIKTILNRKKSLDQDAQQLKPKFSGKVWAVLVAGSNDYINYRHQADVCHAFHVLKNNGIPEERIIVMMYDDIAYNDENPFKGEIINEPNGTNVYVGVPKDYTGSEVTPQMFLRILKGDGQLSKSGRKVLQSTHNDHVFVYFCDHGAPGLLTFPDDTLGARELNQALQYMHDHRRYAELLFYVEACESGSMFKNILPANLSILAVTAANSFEASSACFFDDIREAFLGDVFSYAWIEDTATLARYSHETLDAQIKRVRDQTTASHVSVFGDLNITQRACSQFEAYQSQFHVPNSLEQLTNQFKHWWHRFRWAVPVAHVPMFLSRWRIQHKSGSEQLKAHQSYERLLAGRNLIDRIMSKLSAEYALLLNVTKQYLNETVHEIMDFDCYELLVKHFQQDCFKASSHTYVLRKLRILVNVCNVWSTEGRPAVTLDQLTWIIGQACPKENGFNSYERIH